MKSAPSPNFNERAADVPLAYVVLHYTGMRDGASALARLTSAEAKVSAHYMVDEDGSVYNLVAEDKRAWHAGQSFWRGLTDMNSASIGIEIVNPGHEFGYRPFPAGQLSAVKDLVRKIFARHAIDPAWGLLGHSDIAPSRKQDPGELFPWQSFAQEGLGFWPQMHEDDYKTVAPDVLMHALQRIGYDISAPRAAIIAFQRRFLPHEITGRAEGETAARIQAVARLAS